LSDIIVKNPELEIQQEASQAANAMLANDFKGLFVETMERIFNPVAQMEIIARKSLLTEKEAGLLFSVSPATLRTERSRGIGPGYIKDGKRVLYKREELEAYFNRRVVKRMG
jgi:hypothetical protein